MIRLLALFAVLSFAVPATAQSGSAGGAADTYWAVDESPRARPSPSNLPWWVRPKLSALSELATYDVMNAPALARRAFESGDRRLLIYCGAGCSYPGVTADDVARLGSRTLPGAADLFTGPWDFKRLHGVRDYALAWNAAILQLEREDQPPVP